MNYMCNMDRSQKQREKNYRMIVYIKIPLMYHLYLKTHNTMYLLWICTNISKKMWMMIHQRHGNTWISRVKKKRSVGKEEHKGNLILKIVSFQKIIRNKYKCSY